MHPITGANPEVVSGGPHDGELRWKDTDPPTRLVKADMNALWLGLVRLGQAVGLNLNANEAATIADDWNWIRRAVQMAARKAEETAVVMASSSVNLGLTPDTFQFRLEADGGGDIPDAAVNPEVDSENIGRVIIIRNSSASRKFVNTNDPDPSLSQLPLSAGQATSFYATAGGISGCKWVPLGGGVVRGTLAALARDSANTGNNVAIDLEWVRDYRTGLIVVQVPSIVLTFGSSPGFLHIVPASGDVPVEIKPSGAAVQPPIAMNRNGAITAMYGLIESAAVTERWMAVNPVPAIEDGDVITIRKQAFTYFG